MRSVFVVIMVVIGVKVAVCASPWHLFENYTTTNNSGEPHADYNQDNYNNLSGRVNHSGSDVNNVTWPLEILIIQDERGGFQLRSKLNSNVLTKNSDWLVVGKKTHVKREEQIKHDSSTGTTRRIVDEDRYEELQVLKDNRARVEEHDVHINNLGG